MDRTTMDRTTKIFNRVVRKVESRGDRIWKMKYMQRAIYNSRCNMDMDIWKFRKMIADYAFIKYLMVLDRFEPDVWGTVLQRRNAFKHNF